MLIRLRIGKKLISSEQASTATFQENEFFCQKRREFLSKIPGCETRNFRASTAKYSLMFLLEKIAPTIATCNCRFVVNSWVHTHVRGVKLGFSSMDVHAQYAWSQMFPRAFGLVFEIDSKYKYKYDAYVLTEEGKYRVGECSRLHNLSHQQNEACSSERLHKSVKDTIVFTNSDFTVVDARNTQPFDAAPLMNFEESKSNVAAHKQCRACKRPSADDSDLLNHVSRKKQCRPAYSEK
jgi:hypothetical protein